VGGSLGVTLRAQLTQDELFDVGIDGRNRNRSYRYGTNHSYVHFLRERLVEMG
jgi:hypothetical protein